MSAKILIINLTLCVLSSVGSTTEISSKLDFGEEADSLKKSDVEIIMDTKNQPSGKLELESEESQERGDIKISINKGKAEKLTDKDIVCNSNKCIVEIGGGSNKKTTTTDIHVKISTGIDEDQKEKKNSEESDVPILKGYAGLKPEEIAESKKNKPASGVQFVTETPNIVIPENSGEDTPTIVTQSPENWHDYLNKRFKGRPSVYATTKPHTYHPYTIGDFNNRDDYHNHIPSGWSTGWRPVAPSVKNPGDYYHYNVNNKEKGFYDSIPQFINYCTCTRKPVYEFRPSRRPQSSYPRPVNPWFHEATTKTALDDKLQPPFSKTSKSG